MTSKLPERDQDGKLPAYAWPGGYDIVYYSADGREYCADCASQDDAEPEIVGYGVQEGPAEDYSILCDGCGKAIVLTEEEQEAADAEARRVQMAAEEAEVEAIPSPYVRIMAALALHCERIGAEWRYSREDRVRSESVGAYDTIAYMARGCTFGDLPSAEHLREEAMRLTSYAERAESDALRTRRFQAAHPESAELADMMARSAAIHIERARVYDAGARMFNYAARLAEEERLASVATLWQ